MEEVYIIPQIEIIDLEALGAEDIISTSTDVTNPNQYNKDAF